MSMVRSGFWRDFWMLFKPYWFSEEKVTARLLLFAILALTLTSVYMDVQFNEWYNAFYNALQDKNKAEFYKQLRYFCVLAAIWIVIGVYATYLNQMLQVRWRRWLTDKYLADWLRHRTYYRMQLTGSPTDNPDQRVAEDLRLFVDETLSLSLGLLNSIVTLVAFSGILWKLSGTLEFSVGGQDYLLHGYMVWVALAYTHRRHRLGSPHRQAAHSPELQPTALRGGFSLQPGALPREHGRGRAVPRRRRRDARLSQSLLHRVLELVVDHEAAEDPELLSQRLQPGSGHLPVRGRRAALFLRRDSARRPDPDLQRVRQGARLVELVHQRLFGHRTQHRLRRVEGYRRSPDQLSQRDAGRATTTGGYTPRSQNEVQPAGALQLRNVGIDLPSGAPLLANANLDIAPGSRVLIQGSSGCGKSMLFRTIAGIWPFGRGRIERPPHFDAMFLPQRPYFPLGTLREAVCYPGRPESFTDAEVKDTLAQVGLEQLLPRLDEAANWTMQLSGGEQQRVAFARALLLRPAWLFLDEATSNLDEPSQNALYELLNARLKQSTIISIAHRSDLAQYHDRSIRLQFIPGTSDCLHELASQPA